MSTPNGPEPDADTLSVVSKTGKNRAQKVRVHLSDVERATIAASAALSGEDLGGYLRRLGLADSLRVLGPDVERLRALILEAPPMPAEPSAKKGGAQ